jgi:hypothetical protein
MTHRTVIVGLVPTIHRATRTQAAFEKWTLGTGPRVTAGAFA